VKATILVDNTALFDRYFLAEHGFSVFVEAQGCRVLFDTGYSGALLQNAEKMGIDLLDLDYIVLSHGHLDHTGGLYHLLRLYLEAQIERTACRVPTLVAHPCCFLPRPKPPLPEIGALLSAGEVERFMPVRLSRDPVALAPDLFYLGEIGRRFPFETVRPGPRRIVLPDGRVDEDRLLDDTALAYRGRDGLVVITGCAHAGCCNTIEHAREVCGESRVLDLIGGLHLREPGPQLEGARDYLGRLGLSALHACHCTALQAKVALGEVAPLRETGVGLRLEYGDR